MKQAFAVFGVLGLIAVGMPSDAKAAGGAYGAVLLPTANATACTAELTIPNCESDGYGSAATLRIGRQNYLGIDVSNLIAGQVYMVAYNNEGTESCAGMPELGSFKTGPAGGRNFTVPVDTAADYVSICRQLEDGSFVAILTGQMTRLNGK
jgi:hypothetical protein